MAIDVAGKHGAGLAAEVIGRNLRELGVPAEGVVISNKLGWLRKPLRGSEPTFEPGTPGSAWKHDAELDVSYDGIMACWEQGCELLGEPYRPTVASVHDPDEYLAGAKSPLERQMRLRRCSRRLSCGWLSSNAGARLPRLAWAPRLANHSQDRSRGSARLGHAGQQPHSLPSSEVARGVYGFAGRAGSWRHQLGRVPCRLPGRRRSTSTIGSYHKITNSISRCLNGASLPEPVPRVERFASDRLRAVRGCLNAA